MEDELEINLGRIESNEYAEPRYVISIAAKLVGVQVHTLRYYEKVGIIEPSRSRGKNRLYSERDVALLRQMKNLMEELGVNLAGAEVIMRLSWRVRELQKQVEELQNELGKSGR